MRSSDALGKALRAKLYKIMSEVEGVRFEEIKNDEGLKTSILEDPLFSLTITSATSFKVSALPRDICRSLLRDYLYGFERVKSQWASTSLLAQERKTAWALVSAYYCSFFAAIESLRLCGLHKLSLSKEEGEKLFKPHGGPHLSSILAKSNFKGVISPDFSEIGYTSTGDKPHAATWNLLDTVVFPIVSSKASACQEILKFSNMCKGASGWEKPSDIRNRWNYRDSLYFSDIGETSSSPFLKIIAEDEVASSWIRGKFSVRDEKDSAASIGSLARLLHGAIVDTYDYGFVDSKFMVLD